jgi:hypothetical protein
MLSDHNYCKYKKPVTFKVTFNTNKKLIYCSYLILFTECDVLYLESNMQIAFLFFQKDTFANFSKNCSQNTESCDSSTLMAKILVNNAKTYSKTSE